MTHRQKTLIPIIERMVDEGKMCLMKAPLWAASYPAEDQISEDWILKVAAEREIHNKMLLPPNADSVFCEGK